MIELLVLAGVAAYGVVKSGKKPPVAAKPEARAQTPAMTIATSASRTTSIASASSPAEKDKATITAACTAANVYVAELHTIGLPVPPNWSKLSCDQKIAAVAACSGGGSIAGMVQAAAFVLAAVHANQLTADSKHALALISTSSQAEAGKLVAAAGDAISNAAQGAADAVKKTFRI